MKSSGPSELGVIMRPGGFIRRPVKPAREPAQADGAAHATKALATRIFVKGLQIEAECGVYAFEKGRKRPLLIDIEVTLNHEVRSQTDNLTETVDYDVLVGKVREVVATAHLHLLETIAELICTQILTDHRIETVRLRIEKPGSIDGAICSGVDIERARR